MDHCKNSILSLGIIAASVLGLGDCASHAARNQKNAHSVVSCALTIDADGTKLCTVKQDSGTCSLEMTVYLTNKSERKGFYKGHIDATLTDHAHSTLFPSVDKWYEAIEGKDGKGTTLFVWEGTNDDDAAWNWSFGDASKNNQQDIHIAKRQDASYPDWNYFSVANIRSDGAC